MIDALKPYPKYKESGLPWIDSMPAHWSLRRMKVLFRERVEKGFPNEPLLAATQTKGVVRKEDYGERTVVAQKDLHLLKLVEPNDFVISLRSFQGGIEFSRCRGIISPAYTILAPHGNATREYFSYFFKSPDFIRSLTLFVTGIRQGQNIDYERLSRAYMPLPPSEEQKMIGRFLDHANRRMERFIRAKKKVIALLNEQKQAIIHRAVTRGLDPNVPLKPSGIPWLGDIPGHWEIIKLRFLVDVQGGMTPNKATTSYWNGSVPWVSPKDMKKPEIGDSIDHITDIAVCRTGIRLIPPPAVLIVVRGMILGRTFPVGVTIAPVTINQDMKALIPRPKLDAFYMRHLLVGLQNTVHKLVEESGHGTRVLRTDLWRNLPLPIPPFEEQKHIGVGISRDTAITDAAIHRAEREIGLIREYRTCLIADVVTGKLDVREAARKLPDEADEPLPEADDSEENDETSQIAEDAA